MRKSLFSKLAALALGACALTAQAGTNGFIVPAFRGTASAQAGYWEIFTVAVGAPGNLPDKPGATTGAVLTQTDTNAFLTGSGNIYNLDGTSRFTLTNATPFTLGTVVLQTRTLGTELDYLSPVLNYSDGFGPLSVRPLCRFEVNRGNQPGLGATVSSLWQWDLRGLGISNYTVTFRAAAPSTSFDSMTLDAAEQFTPLQPQPFAISGPDPSIERWNYANNAAPCDRPAGASFGTFGDEAGVDTRHAQHLVGWDTALIVPTNRGPANYFIRRCRVTLTINRGNLFAFDPTQDDFRTFFETNHPAWLPDADTGRPMELFGVGYRNGFDVVTFDQCALFGSNAPGQRNAYAAGWSTNGALVDVGNNVGKTNAAWPRFEVAPFAIGQTTNVAPGQLVPAGAKITFDLNVADPLVVAYLQAALDAGRLRLLLSSLHGTSGQFGSPQYPDFATRFNDAVVYPTGLEINGVAVRPLDSDGDGLPDDWENFYFGNLASTAVGDPDGDGAKTLDEFRAATDPTRADSVLRLLAPVRGAGLTTLRFPHAAGRSHAVLFTEDFGSWLPLTNAPLFRIGTPLMELTDDAAGAAKRFYRVRAQ